MVPGGDSSLLQTTISSYISTRGDIYYIYILDAGGLPLISATKVPMAPPSFYGSPFSGAASELTYSKLRLGRVEIQDIAAPIAGGISGAVHVGLTYSELNQVVATHMRHILLWLIGVAVLGVSIAFVLSREVTSPLTALAAEARALAKGSFQDGHRHWGNDEIASVGRAFDEMSHEIRQKEEMRKQLLAQVLSAQEAERKRIARELHDDTSQGLTSLMVELKALEKATDVLEVRQKLAELREFAHQTLEGVHHMSVELRPNVLDDLGLNAALGKYVADFTSKTGIRGDLQITGGAKQRLPPDVETAAYRIAQEALANVARHAEAKNVSLVVGFQDSNFSMVIEDDGVGFDVDEAMQKSPEYKLGLFGMYERASLVGGSLSIESAPGQGSSVFLEIPVRESESTGHA